MLRGPGLNMELTGHGAMPGSKLEMANNGLFNLQQCIQSSTSSPLIINSISCAPLAARGVRFRECALLQKHLLWRNCRQPHAV